MLKKRGAAILKAAVSGALLYVLFRRVDTGVFLETVSSINPSVIILLALAYIVLQCLSTYRWSIVLRKDADVRYTELLSIYFIGMFFNNFLPTLVGGDLVKGYYLYRKTEKGEIAFASIFMDRYSGFAALIAITLISLLFGWGFLHRIGGAGLIWVFILLICGFFGLSFIFWFERLHSFLANIIGHAGISGMNEKMDSFYRVFMNYKGRREVLFKIFSLSLIIQSGVIICYFVLGRSVGIDVPVGYFFLFVPLAIVFSMVPLSLSGLGIREGVFIFLFTKAGVSREAALSMSLIWFMVVAAVSMAGAFEYVRRGEKRGQLGIEGGN